MILDKNRAQAISIRQYTGGGPDANGVLTLDSDLVPEGSHWIIECLHGIAYGTLANPIQPAYTGLFLCPNGTPKPAAPTGNDYPSFQDLINSRPIHVPFSVLDDQLTSIGPTGFPNVFQFKAESATGINLPTSWFMRLVLQYGGGTAVAAGSLAYMGFSYVEELNC